MNESKIKIALGSLECSKSNGGLSISSTKRNLQITLNSGLETPSLNHTKLESNPKIKLHINGIRLKIQPQQQKSLTPRPGLLNDLLGLLGGGIDGPKVDWMWDVTKVFVNAVDYYVFYVYNCLSLKLLEWIVNG
ncbi:hypothetical protein G4B88_010264 [Cannabis sativa]|uniref:Uncharacterized protein n=1 Tax=Cannabis sativa TaxID=3483 RepID=A0A7J6I5E4_CANSA|nr:hypothetical protein G4B88_010264 [Cannabis sativa]